MGNLRKQIFSGQFKWVLLCILVLGFALVGLSFYSSGKDDLPTGTAPMTSTATQDLPLIDQVVVEQTEFALFALG